MKKYLKIIHVIKKNQVKEIKKRIYNPHRKIQSLNGFIHNNDKIETYLNQLYNIKLQNNSKVINSSKKINYSNFLNNQNKFNKNRINTEFN